ncbi:MAG: fumarylacetoacetate hydrolase family protein [Acidobacteria bacterium]|nr:fumarylacetoacetate hydrolase family protein [Acidobacteriota bacterium]
MVAPRAEHEKIADLLWQAEQQRRPIAPISTDPHWTVTDAYSIQRAYLDRKGNQQKRAGHKVGLTSIAMQRLLNVNEPDWGVLLSSMDLSGTTSCARHTMIQPKIEPEIAFRMKRDLKGPGVTLVDALAAIDRAYPALEIIDSRIADWKIQLVDTVADNASSAYFTVAGEGVPVHDLDLVSLGMMFSKNGEVVATGAGSAVLGHPAAAVAWLANTLGEFGEALHAGDLVLPGALVAAANVAPGDTFSANFSGLGAVSISFS